MLWKIFRRFAHRFSSREHLVADLRDAKFIDRPVSLHGWLQYRRMNSFGVLRDHSGVIQFLLPTNLKDERQTLKKTPVESCVHLQGVLRQRPTKDRNAQMPLGDLEVRSLRSFLVGIKSRLDSRYGLPRAERLFAGLAG